MFFKIFSTVVRDPSRRPAYKALESLDGGLLLGHERAVLGDGHLLLLQGLHQHPGLPEPRGEDGLTAVEIVRGVSSGALGRARIFRGRFR